MTRPYGIPVFIGLVLAVATRQPGAVSAQKPDPPQKTLSPGRGVAPTTGWQRLIRDGCQFEVPISWRPAADGDSVNAPDGSNLSIRGVQILNWSQHKAQIREAFVHLKVVHEDSDRRFWFEIGTDKDTMHYVAVRNGVSACIGLLEIRGASAPMTEGTRNRIVASIGPAAVP
jgi:hypothetical protein